MFGFLGQINFYHSLSILLSIFPFRIITFKVKFILFLLFFKYNYLHFQPYKKIPFLLKWKMQCINFFFWGSTWGKFLTCAFYKKCKHAHTSTRAHTWVLLKYFLLISFIPTSNHWRETSTAFLVSFEEPMNNCRKTLVV